MTIITGITMAMGKIMGTATLITGMATSMPTPMTSGACCWP
jgi:hypothetical protein